MRRPTTSSALRRRRRRKKTQKKQQTWLDSKFIRGVRKMKLVGLKQALKPGIFWIERLLWIGVFVFCVGVAAYLTVATVQEHSENPTMNNFHDDEPIFKVPFPATTITGTSILHNDVIHDTDQLFYDMATSEDGKTSNNGIMWTDHLLNVLMFTIDHLCELVNSFASKAKILDTSNPEYFKLQDDENWVKRTNITLYDNKNDTDLRDTVIPFLKNKTLDCEKIVAACFWEGTEENCTDIFVPIQTDVGNGCSFNRIPDQILRKGQGLISVFNNHNYTKEQLRIWGNYQIDSAMSVEGLRDFKELTQPRAQHNAGKLSGLSFMLIFDEDSTGTSCPIVDSYGYLIGIHSPFEDPRIMQTAVTVPPGNEVFIKVKAEITIADKQIKSLSIEKRKCLFQKENPLQNFNIYTVGNCHQECLGRKIHEKCNCSLLTLSAGQNERLCGPLEVNCVRNTTALLENSGYDKQCQNPVCYSACTEIKYDADVSYLPYRQNQGFDFSSRKSLINHSLTSIVHITHGSNSVPTRERKLQLGFSILFGVIGGTWGTILEFSLFTFFNIVAGLVVWLTPNCLVIDEDGNGTGNNSEHRGSSLRSETRRNRNMVEQDQNFGFINSESRESGTDGNTEERIQHNQETRIDQEEGTPANQNPAIARNDHQEIPMNDNGNPAIIENQNALKAESSETPNIVHQNAPMNEFQEISLDDYTGTQFNEYQPMPIDNNAETAINENQVIPIDHNEEREINELIPIDHNEEREINELIPIEGKKETRVNKYEVLSIDDTEETTINVCQVIPIEDSEETTIKEYQVVLIEDNEETTINKFQEPLMGENAEMTNKISDTTADQEKSKADTDFKETPAIEDKVQIDEVNTNTVASACKAERNGKTQNPSKTSQSLDDLWPKSEIETLRNSHPMSATATEVAQGPSREQNCDLKDQDV